MATKGNAKSTAKSSTKKTGTSTRTGSTGASKKTTTRSTSAKSTGSRSSASKSAATKGSKGKASAKNTKPKMDDSLHEEIVALLILAVAVIFLLSNFGLAGMVGENIQKVMFGLFGVVEYVLPVILAGLILLILFNKNVSVVRIKAIAVAVAIIFLSGLCALFVNNPEVASAGLGEYYSVSSANKSGGGFFGGLITWALSPIGTVGSYVVLIILLIICLVIITEHSFLGGVRNQGSKVYNTAKNDYEAYKEQSAIKRQQHEELRLARQKERQERQALEQEKKNKEEADRKTSANDSVNTGTATTVQITGPDPATASMPPLDVITGSANKKVKPRKKPDGSEAKVVAPVVEAQAGSLVGEQQPDVFSAIDVSHGNEAKRSDNKAKGIVADTVIPRGTANKDIHELNADIQREDKFAGDIYTPKAEEVRNENTWTNSYDVKPQPKHEEPVVTEVVQGKVESSAKAADSANIAQGVINKVEHKPEVKYVYPPMNLLERSTKSAVNQDSNNKETALRLQQTLQNFGVKVTITDISCGPSVTRFELQPEQGVKVSKIVSLSDDIKLNLAAADIRIEAPIPGKAAIGIEVPNKVSTGVKIRELIESETFRKHPSNIVFAAGKDIAGQVILADIAKMPHLLIAGATGSGKSVCINTIIMSILYKSSPEDVKLIMVDPKVVELSVYNGIPHLLIPVVTDPKKASAALNWAVSEMTERFQKFATLGVRDLKGYNEKIATLGDENYTKMPQIVIIIDELADLMMVAPGEVEDAICRIAQLARAAGIHLVVATQRPSVNVITGVIKANIPSRIAFSVSSGVDSRTIIDMNGAEKLLGRGDMLFYPSGYQKPVRVQGAFVSDKEVNDVVEFVKSNVEEVKYNDNVTSHLENQVTMNDSQAFGGDRDQYFADAGRFVIEKEKGSIGILQRYFKIGFNRAARIMDQLADAGVVGPEEGTKPRKILMTMEEFEEYLKR